MPTPRRVREDDDGLYVTLNGWVMRPSGPTEATAGSKVRVVGSGTPAEASFGLIMVNGRSEYWQNHNQERVT